IERRVRLAIEARRGARWWVPPPVATLRRAVVVAAVVTTSLLVPLVVLRWYQDRRAIALLGSYVAASTSDLPLASVAPGRLRLPADPNAPPLRVAAAASAHRTFPMKTIVHVVGARPSYMKIAPLMAALSSGSPFRQVLVNTGQHYDDMMARAFVRDLGLPTPDYDLGVGSA